MSAEDSSTPAPAGASEEDQRRARAWFRHLRTERGRSRNTLDNYSRDIDRYLHWLASRSLDMTSVSTGDVEDFIMDLRKGHPVTGGRRWPSPPSPGFSVPSGACTASLPRTVACRTWWRISRWHRGDAIFPRR